MVGENGPTRWSMLTVGVVALLGFACGTPAGQQVMVQSDRQVPPEAPVPARARSLAEDASSSSGTDGTLRVSPDGVSLEVGVEYFQPLRAGDWVAPAGCAYSTSVQVTLGDGVQKLETTSFAGPSSDNDVGSEGLLGAVVPWQGPDGAEALLMVVVAYAHDTLVTLSPGEEAESGPYAPLDVQPADGWTSLGVLVKPVNGSAPLGAQVTFERFGAETTSFDIELPRLSQLPSLAVLTDEWVFDWTAVDERCAVPEDAAAEMVEPALATSDAQQGFTDPIAVGPASNKPVLPPPGEQPAGVVAQTSSVLEAIRTVYDLTDIYAEQKAQRFEDPALGLQILRETQANQVIEPYLGALDPIFDSVVFTSPTEASVLYRVGPSYSWEIGRVLLIDGLWRVALGTICRDLLDAFYECPGSVVPDPPPGPLGLPTVVPGGS